MILAKQEVGQLDCEDNIERWQAVSQTDTSKSYIIEFHNDMEQAVYECECPSFKYDEDNIPATCKHIEAVKQLKYRQLTKEIVAKATDELTKEVEGKVGMY